LSIACATLLSPLPGSPAWAQDASALESPDITAAASATADLYLDVTLNGEPLRLIAHFVKRGNTLFASADDLNELGIATTSRPALANELVELGALPGLTYAYDAAHQTIELRVPEGLLIRHRVNARAIASSPPASSGRGVVLNYDFYAQTEEHSPAALWTEARYFDPAGVFSNTGVASFYRSQQRYLRYDTSWSWSNPDVLTTTQFGDTTSSSLAWTRSLRLGGFQWRSNFALRPDLVTFPVPTLLGSAVVPSAVDLYVNNVRQFSGNVPSGPFVLNNVPGITGAGNATIVTHDALGRSVATSMPLYIDTRLLAAGLASYSFEAGFLRRAYGLNSFDYDTRPAISATARYGVSETLTVEAHGEGTNDFVDIGAGALVQLGMAGVASASLARSAGPLAGTQLGLGYQLIEPYFSINAQTQRTFGNYGDLAARDGTPVPSISDSVTLSLMLVRGQMLTLSYINVKYPGVQSSQIGSITDSISLGKLASINLSAFQDFHQRNSRGVFVSLNLGLANSTSVSANVGRQNGDAVYSLNATRPPDYDGGLGWAVQAGQAGAQRYAQAQAQYLDRVGQLNVLTQSIGGRGSASLDATGALVLMDGAALPSRRIDDGFALVSTDATRDVPVLHENRPIGTTNGSGHFLVPNLNSYQNNQISIDSMALPIDVRLGRTVQNVVPQARSGVLARFAMAREQAASVVLRGADNAPLPVGLKVRQVETGIETIVGYDGLVFVSGLGSFNHLEIEGGGKRCTVAFYYVRPADSTLPTIGPLSCELK
jgi:outer membrane usher protein